MTLRISTEDFSTDRTREVAVALRETGCTTIIEKDEIVCFFTSADAHYMCHTLTHLEIE